MLNQYEIYLLSHYSNMRILLNIFIEKQNNIANAINFIS